MDRMPHKLSTQNGSYVGILGLYRSQVLNADSELQIPI